MSSRNGERRQVRAVRQGRHPCWSMKVIRVKGVWRDIPKIFPSGGIFSHQQKAEEIQGELHPYGHRVPELKSRHAMRTGSRVHILVMLHYSDSSKTLWLSMAWSSPSRSGKVSFAYV